VLCGRGKKNWKTSDLILAALYRFLVWLGDKGNDCFILANEEGQAADDLSLAKNLIAVNPILAAEVVINDKEIARRRQEKAVNYFGARRCRVARKNGSLHWLRRNSRLSKP
jgi:hypothetical protein